MQPRLDYLRRLSTHLKKGKLGHKRFYFGAWNTFFWGGVEKAPIEPYKCGYAGCAIGECPIVFKNQGWKFNQDGQPVHGSSREIRTSITKFFKITEREAQHLFFPLRQNPDKFGGEVLLWNASRRDVAHNIDIFIARKRRQLRKAAK
jgi:hypothetical protein